MDSTRRRNLMAEWVEWRSRRMDHLPLITCIDSLDYVSDCREENGEACRNGGRGGTGCADFDTGDPQRVAAYNAVCLLARPLHQSGEAIYQIHIFFLLRHHRRSRGVAFRTLLLLAPVFCAVSMFRAFWLAVTKLPVAGSGSTRVRPGLNSSWTRVLTHMFLPRLWLNGGALCQRASIQ